MNYVALSRSSLKYSHVIRGLNPPKLSFFQAQVTKLKHVDISVASV